MSHLVTDYEVRDFLISFRLFILFKFSQAVRVDHMFELFAA